MVSGMLDDASFLRSDLYNRLSTSRVRQRGVDTQYKGHMDSAKLDKVLMNLIDDSLRRYLPRGDEDAQRKAKAELRSDLKLETERYDFVFVAMMRSRCTSGALVAGTIETLRECAGRIHKGGPSRAWRTRKHTLKAICQLGVATHLFRSDSEVSS